MKIKNKLLIFLGIFIIMFIPKNVFAEEVFPWYANINGEAFNSGNTGYHNWYTMSLDPGASGSFNVNIQSYDYDSLGLDESFIKYPYILLYFQTWNTKEQIGIKKNDACNSSCFKQHNIGLKYIGDDISSGRHMYVLILQAMKWQLDCGSSGNNQCIYKIEDSFTITNNNTSSSTNKAFIFYNAVLSDNSNIISDNSINFNNLITNASNNANSIMSNANQNRQQIINNNNTNTTNIINNQNSNQAQTNQKLDNVNNTLNSEEGVANNDVSNKANEWSSKLAGTGPVSQMVLMPITLLNGYVSGLNATCSPYNLGNLMGTDIILPCINISNYVGVSLWNVIDVLFSGFMIYAIGKKFVKIFNDFTNLRDNQMDDLYGGGK